MPTTNEPCPDRQRGAKIDRSGAEAHEVARALVPLATRHGVRIVDALRRGRHARVGLASALEAATAARGMEPGRTRARVVGLRALGRRSSAARMEAVLGCAARRASACERVARVARGRAGVEGAVRATAGVAAAPSSSAAPCAAVGVADRRRRRRSAARRRRNGREREGKTRDDEQRRPGLHAQRVRKIGASHVAPEMPVWKRIRYDPDCASVCRGRARTSGPRQ
ncbi:MAG: hypothetical protein JWO86_2093 [Myxococcaceae bacterium]|nr:hypothetical protein [Myxococcaceae bacterium]